jgi:hypothetical protein
MSDTFTYWGVDLPYFHHLYNLTMLNERAVELAVARHWLSGKSETGLEVGNVTGHYDRRGHAVIDLNEPAAWYQRDQWVISTDILHLDWPDVPKSFPWVLSISTIEHTQEPITSLIVLKSLVEPGGQLLVTFPTGVDGPLDIFATAGFPNMNRGCTIVRTEDGWAQTDEPEIREYGPWANSVAICEWTAPD